MIDPEALVCGIRVTHRHYRRYGTITNSYKIVGSPGFDRTVEVTWDDQETPAAVDIYELRLLPPLEELAAAGDP